ncbi:hypothetical protein D046_4685B, partial [Vibrio parahaemolyticus V-223/04]
PEAL